MNVVFYGTPDFAVPALTRLLDSPHRVAAVVTQPDRARGRGQRVSESPVKRTATARGARVLQPERLGDGAFLQTLSALEPDLAVVAAYGRMLPDAVLAAPRLRTINIHPSLLPKYRGAAPVQRAIIAGETETGVTIMRLVREMGRRPDVRPADAPHRAGRDQRRRRGRPRSPGRGSRAGGHRRTRSRHGHRARTGPRGGHARAAAVARGRQNRLARPGSRDPQPGARPASLAARFRGAGRRPLSHPPDPCRRSPGTGRTGAGNPDGSVRRPAAGGYRSRRRPRHPGDSARGAAPDRRPGLSGWPPLVAAGQRFETVSA